jgi:hypothetical protein
MVAAHQAVISYPMSSVDEESSSSLGTSALPASHLS